MATNDFLPFAIGGSANVLTQAQWAALGALLNGFQSGIADSKSINKAFRQSSIMSAVVAQFIVNQTGQNATDDGTTATLIANLLSAIRRVTQSTVVLADTGAANAYTAVNSPPLVAGTWVDGFLQAVKIAHANTGASTYAPDGLTAIPIYGLGLQPLQGGELALGGTALLMRTTIPGVNSGNPICVLMECAGGAQQVASGTQSQHAVNLSQFAAVLSANGYVKIPTPAGTIIIQWGTFTTSNTADVNVTFPITFPTTIAPRLIPGNNSSAGLASVGSNAVTASGFTANGWASSGARTTIGTSYIAIGW